MAGLPADFDAIPEHNDDDLAQPYEDPPRRATTPAHLLPDRHIDLASRGTGAKRQYRHLLARTADGVAFDELFFLQIYLTISGLRVGRSDWKLLAIGMTGGFFLGLLTPVVVIVALHVFAEHVVRLRHGMLKAPAYMPPQGTGRRRHVVAAIRWVPRHWRAWLLLLRSATRRFATPDLVLLFVTLPWIVFLARFYAENPRADQLAGMRAEDEARPPTDLRRAEEAFEAARDAFGQARGRRPPPGPA
ncbi:hypothetical protein [Amycolatopsis sp. cmx-4-83]|uniref:hypothetical protein n=1 Tax=Amycolatopsis sp. cmx-4-83 TaxID=2790940 RepID=UPI00397CAC7E